MPALGSLLPEDMARSDYLKEEWADSHGFETMASIGMFMTHIMQDVSVQLMQVTANACILHRMRQAMYDITLSAQARKDAGAPAASGG